MPRCVVVVIQKDEEEEETRLLFFVFAICDLLCLQAFRPTQFCYAVRREGAYPDGTLAIEEHVGGGTYEPITTCARRLARPNKTASWSLRASALNAIGSRAVALSQR